MREVVACLIIILIFLVYSYFIHVYLRKISSKISVIGIILAYIISIWPYFELINHIHQSLRDRKFYIDFGHASILLVELAFACLILAIINVIWATVKRK